MSCYLNNLAVINALGSTKAQVCANFLAGNNAGIRRYQKLFSGRETYAGIVQDALLTIPSEFSEYNCRNNQLLITAYQTLVADVQQLIKKYGAHRIGVILGTSTSGILASEIAFKQLQQQGNWPVEFDYRQQEIGACAEFLAGYAGLTGPAYVVSTACSSSGKAFAMADRLINNNICDAIIVGGSDSLCELTLNGFDSLELLADNICLPFSKNRNGINIGEGAALFVVSKEPAPIKLLGTGESSDAYHMSAPEPKGRGAILAMQKALQMAALLPEQIGYINLHGTGTVQNDQMESEAVHKVFANKPWCSSTKPLTGHTLGAAGAQDLALCWLLLSDYNTERMLPAQLADHEYDGDLAPLNLLRQATPYDQPIFMSNSFGFGGSNVSVVIGKEV